MGRLLFEAVGNRDYPLMQTLFLFTTVGVLLANLLADIAATAGSTRGCGRRDGIMTAPEQSARHPTPHRGRDTERRRQVAVTSAAQVQPACPAGSSILWATARAGSGSDPARACSSWWRMFAPLIAPYDPRVDDFAPSRTARPRPLAGHHPAARTSARSSIWAPAPR